MRTNSKVFLKTHIICNLKEFIKMHLKHTKIHMVDPHDYPIHLVNRYFSRIFHTPKFFMNMVVNIHNMLIDNSLKTIINNDFVKKKLI